MFRRGGNKRPRFSVGGHSVFEHDDSSNHSGVGTFEYDDDSQSQHNTTSTGNFEQTSFSHGHFPPDRPRRVQRPLTKSHHDDNINLNACLDHLLRILSRKDKQGFFQYPVTDQLAPGYSQIITRPMDFSTMKRKITQDEYSNIVEFRSDFELMCDNAMKYNRSETIYWRAADKLLSTGTKLMNKEKLISFRRSVECFSRLTERELGFRIDSSSNHNIDEFSSHLNESLDASITDTDQLSSISVSQALSQRKPKLILKLPKFYDKPPAIPSDELETETDEILTTTVMPVDDYPPEEILFHAQQAARCAREKLNLRLPMISYTVSYQRMSNATSLRLTNQADRTQQTINLIESSYLPSIDDSTTIYSNNEQRSYSSARDYLDHGPFSSQSNTNESLFCSLPKDQLELLIHTYGSEFSSQYAVSLMEFVKNAGDLALAYVDRFLSVLTNGEHDNFLAKKRQQQETETRQKVDSSNTVSFNESESIKIEPQINTFDNHVSDNSKLLMQMTQPIDEHSSNSSFQEQQQQNNVSISDYVFADLPDLTHLSNGPETLISTDSIETNFSMINNNDTTFDSFE